MSEQPVAAQPVAAQPVAAQVVQVQGAAPGQLQQQGQPPPNGAPPGGHWMEQPFVGPTTMMINAGLCLCFCLPPCWCCCPCDKRYVYIAPNGVAYMPTGMVAPPRTCECMYADK